MIKRDLIKIKMIKSASVAMLLFVSFLHMAGSLRETTQNPQAILIPVNAIPPINRIMSLSGQGRVEMIGFSPDGKLVCLSGGPKILLWDLSSGSTKDLAVPTRAPVFFSAFDFSPDGKYLAIVLGREKVILLDLQSGTSRVLNGASSGSGASFSPDGNYLVINASSGGLEVWEVSTGKKINTFLKKKGKTFGRTMFSPDGKYIAAINNEGKNIVIMEANSGKLLRIFSGHQGLINDFVFSRDGKLLISGGSDKRIIVWDSSSGEKLKDINPLPAGVNDLDISPDGRWLAVVLGPYLFPWEPAKPETSVMVLDLKTGEGKGLRVPFCYSLGISPDGKFLVTGISSGEELAAIWEINSYEIADKFRKDPFETTAEYEARVSQVEIPYSEAIALNPAQYNADRGGFEIQFRKNRLFIQVEREKARKLLERKAGELQLRGQLKYHDQENLRLEGAVLEDRLTGDRFPVVKTGEVQEEKTEPR